jgi:flagellar motor switch protein FliM
MNPPGETSEQPNPFGASDVESLLASVAQMEQADAPAKPASPEKDASQPCDFRNPSLLSPREMRKLRLHEAEFARSLASRLSSHLRLEFTLDLTDLRTITYQTFSSSWAEPTQLTLFKLEPLRGIGVLEISPQLGVIIVDRLMGGSGQAPETLQEMSEIETALLEQTVQLILEEWCAQWTRLKEMKPVLLGCETNGRFVQVASSETALLVLTLGAVVGDHTGKIQIGIPFAALEPLIHQLTKSVVEVAAQAVASSPAKPAPATPAAAVAAAPVTPGKWNHSFDEVCVPLSAEWEGIEITAREIISLKVGDVLPLTPQVAQKVSVRLGDLPKFQGRPGSCAGNWAVELTQAIKH